MREVRSSMVVVVRALDVAAPREVLAFLGGRPTGGMVGLGVVDGKVLLRYLWCDEKKRRASSGYHQLIVEH